MAKFADLDRNHKCTIATNFSALNLAAKLLAAAATDKFIIPKNMNTQEEWIAALTQQAANDLRHGKPLPVEVLCRLIDDEIEAGTSGVYTVTILDHTLN